MMLTTGLVIDVIEGLGFAIGSVMCEVKFKCLKRWVINVLHIPTLDTGKLIQDLPTTSADSIQSGLKQGQGFQPGQSRRTQSSF